MPADPGSEKQLKRARKVKSGMSLCWGNCQPFHLIELISVRVQLLARGNDKSDTVIVQASLLGIDYRKSNELITR